VYSRLDVDPRLRLCGESFYNDLIPTVIDDLTRAGLAVESEGALVVHIDGSEVPLMLRKSDGGYGYDSTDMAAIRYRLHTLKCDRVVYVVDAGQSLHFDVVFKGAQKAGWYDPADKRVEHVAFGVIQGEDKKKYKTRSGETVRLVDVLDEARDRAEAELRVRIAKTAAEGGKAAAGLDTSDEHIRRTASVLGYGSVKYFDLRQHRSNDYVFNYDRMLTPDGDTAVYLEYAHARLCSIERKAREMGIDVDAVVRRVAEAGGSGLRFSHPSEVALVNEAAHFSAVLREVEGDLCPHHLTEFLFHLSQTISAFHRDCLVLHSDTPADVRDWRLCMIRMVTIVVAATLRLVGVVPLDRI
jgi:arginyl-tRNA synthetase